MSAILAAVIDSPLHFLHTHPFWAVAAVCVAMALIGWFATGPHGKWVR